MRPLLLTHFRRPELVGRIQLIAPFFPLTHAEATEAASGLLAARAASLAGAPPHHLALTWTRADAEALAGACSEEYGVRDMKAELNRCAHARPTA